MSRILFICNQNQHRSKTAEDLFRKKFETKSAGLFSQKPVTKKELSWADVIFVMEEEQRHELAKRFPTVYMQKRILNLNVPDIYSCHDPRLIRCLQSRLKEYADLL